MLVVDFFICKESFLRKYKKKNIAPLVGEVRNGVASPISSIIPLTMLNINLEVYK
jgi:hypothetical protein